MDSKKIIAKLIKIAHNQQKIIEKLSQTVVPNASQSVPPPPQALPEPNRPDFHEVQTLINALPANLKPRAGIVQEVKVLPQEVHVRFETGKGSNADWNAIMATVQKVLPGKTVKTV